MIARIPPDELNRQLLYIPSNLLHNVNVHDRGLNAERNNLDQNGQALAIPYNVYPIIPRADP